jgi:hypothetical protein
VTCDRGGWGVEQSWGGIRLGVTPARLRGREVAVCTGTLNDYLIVLLSDPAALEEFGLQEVTALWHEARSYSGFTDPLRCRLAAVCPTGAVPFAKFFTCGRTHPGAPLTGLATLALAAARVEWLAPLLQCGRLRHRRGVDPIPVVHPGPHDAEIRFTPIDVVLQGI